MVLDRVVLKAACRCGGPRPRQKSPTAVSFGPALPGGPCLPTAWNSSRIVAPPVLLDPSPALQGTGNLGQVITIYEAPPTDHGAAILAEFPVVEERAYPPRLDRFAKLVA